MKNIGNVGTGLILPVGASSGKILTSDNNGNASWQTGSVLIYTEVHTFFNNNANYSTDSDFGTVIADNVVLLYGSFYGFVNASGSGLNRYFFWCYGFIVFFVTGITISLMRLF